MTFHDYGGGWPVHVTVAERRRLAEREVAKLRKKGHAIAPVAVGAGAIAKTFWGKSWCDNLERYSDQASRLPRGRSYLRSGAVIDLQIRPERVDALVLGSELYDVALDIDPIEPPRWQALCADCASSIDSLVELLQGRLSAAVMERVCRPDAGLFPAPDEIEMACSCPDYAGMCKHVAAVLYGIGARLDARPELLFALRGVDAATLIAGAPCGHALGAAVPSGTKVLEGSDLSALFGLHLAPEVEPASTASPVPRPEPLPTAKKAMAKASGKTPAGTSAVPLRIAAVEKKALPARPAAARKTASAKKAVAARKTIPAKKAAPAGKAAPAR